jgi:hypothetical protein
MAERKRKQVPWRKMKIVAHRENGFIDPKLMLVHKNPNLEFIMRTP